MPISSLQKELIHVPTVYENHENALSERSQLQKPINCMIPFTWNFQNWQLYRKSNSGYLGLGLKIVGGGREKLPVAVMFSWEGGWWKCSKIVLRMNACLSECTKSHWIVHIKQGNLVVCELHLSKAVK